MRDSLDVATVSGVRAVNTDGKVIRDVANCSEEHDSETEGKCKSRDALSLERFDKGLRAVDTDQHENEQEQHHDRAGIDNDLRHTQERCALAHVEDRQRDHRGRYKERAVDGSSRDEHSDRTDDSDRSTHPENDLLSGVTRLFDRGKQHAHVMTSSSTSSPIHVPSRRASASPD